MSPAPRLHGSSLAGAGGRWYQGRMPASPAPSPAAGRRPRNQLGIVLMIGSILCLAAMEAIAKILVDDYPVQMIVCARLALHFLVTLPLFFFGGRLHLLKTNRPVMHSVRSLILVAASFLFITALTQIPLAQATSLVFTAPFVVTALSAMFLGEKVGVRRWVAILVGFAGVLVILRPNAEFNWFLLLPLATGFCYAGYQVTTRVLSFTEPTLTLFFYTVAAGTLVSGALLPFYWVTPDFEASMLFVLTGAFGFLGQYLVIRALQEGEASIVAPFIYTQIIWATIFGIVLFAQYPDLWTFIGAGIVIGSGIYIWHRERRRAIAAARETAAADASHAARDAAGAGRRTAGG